MKLVLAILLFTTGAWATDLVWDAPTEGLKPTCYKVYRGKASKVSVTDPDLGPAYEEVWEIPATATRFELPTPAKAGKYYVRMTSCIREADVFSESDFSPDEENYKHKSKPPKNLAITK